ncbi:hypothetical protein QF047_002243 [Arthrobacter sp. W4I7]|nr:hypothetical protein [Arthrobacter sp. W4I7]
MPLDGFEEDPRYFCQISLDGCVSEWRGKADITRCATAEEANHG